MSVDNGKLSMEALRDKYERAGQGHVFRFSNQLNEQQLEELRESLSAFDPEEINAVYQRSIVPKAAQNDIKPFPNVCKYEGSQPDRARWEKIGYEKINQGKTAVLLLAGGQGTRLGTINPKGMYNIGLPSGKSLFQIQAERLLKVQQLASKHTNPAAASVVPWYIMTSESTKDMTVRYFESHKYFGLEASNVFFFEQAMAPCITPEGKILMETKSKVSCSPNGNGGLYAALNTSGALADMEKRGVEFVFVYGVDNCLIKMADPIFFGYCFEKQLDCSPKVVAKLNPEEPVGVVCINNGKQGVIEYSEIDKELAKKTDPKTGKLIYDEAHVCMNMFSVDFLKKICRSKLNSLPYHIAKKKIPAVNDKGETETPNDINGWKMELFIFDVFEFAENMGAFEVLRHEEFSPLKNGPDSKQDSPVSCIKHLTQLHKQYIINAGATITNVNEDLPCEISPLVSYAGEGLEHLKGKSITLPFYLQ